MSNPQYLFDLSILDGIKHHATLKSNLKLRPLELKDVERGYLSLLSQLTTVGEVSHEQFNDQFKRMKKTESYFITVIEDCNSGRVVATASLFTEYKFIHSTALRARIEDVVVDVEYRSLKLGGILIETLKQLSKQLGCYKLTLDCNDEMISWYARFGFVAEAGRANVLTIRLGE